MNMYVDPYQFICKTDTHTNESCARNQINQFSFSSLWA